MSRVNAAFDLVVLGDFLAGKSGRIRTIDKDELDGFFTTSAPTLELASGPVSFAGFRDLRPEALADRLPSCAHLRELLGALRELERGRQTREQFGAWLGGWTGTRAVASAIAEALELAAPTNPAAATPATATPGTATPATATRPPSPAPAKPDGAPSSRSDSKDDDPLAAIFDAVDVGGSAEARREPPGASSLLEGLLSGIVGRAGERKTGVAEAIRIAEGALGAEVAQLFADPRFRELESTWLGLRFLVRRLDFRAGIHLHVLPTPASNLTRAIRDVALPHIDALRDEGRSVVLLADFDLADAEELRAVARELEAASLPLVTSPAPRLFGLESWGEFLESTDLAALQANPEWTQLRKDPATRWIALAVNRLLARAPFGPEGDLVKGFTFSEPGPAWMRPCYAIGERIAAAAVRTGWALDCVGAGEGGRIDDLPLVRRATKTGDDVALSTEGMISEQRLLDLSRLGLVPLAARRNDDHAFVSTAPLLFAPARGTDDRANQMNARRATLPYQLMVNQITTLVRQVYPHLDAHASPIEIARTLSAGIGILTLSPEGPRFAIEVTSPSAEEDHARTMSIRLTPLQEPMRGLPDFELELPIPGRG